MSHSEKKLLENRPKIAIYKYWYFSSIPCVFCLYTSLKAVTYYDLSVLSMSVMGLQQQKLDGGE